MSFTDSIRGAIMRFLKIEPAQDTAITINASMSFEVNVLKNRLWYRGDPEELDQFYKGTQASGVARARFWAAVPSLEGSVRKFHSGLPGEIVDKLKDIVVDDLDTIQVNQADDAEESEDSKRWEEIAKDNRFKERVFGDAVKDTLITGDGAFKISIDTELSDYPIIEFFSGEQLKYEYNRGRLKSITFFIQHKHNKKLYRLEEKYEKNGIKYKLFEDGQDKELPLNTVPELANLTDVTWSGDFMAAVPMRFYESAKFENRGQSIYERKTDPFDALDEVISQWIDAIRAGRVKTYIPEDLIPINEETGKHMQPNPFDNMFIQRLADMKESAQNNIDQIQADINLSAYVESYASKLDLCLQGILSPSTLGIDLKKTDNALAQREKEKTTLYTRGKIQGVLYEVLPELVKVALLMDDRKRALENSTPVPVKEYDVSVQFGEYASPDFNETVAVVGQARTMGLMSLEKAVDELYGDTLTAEEKQTEIERIRSEMSMIESPPLKDLATEEDYLDG